MITQVHPVFLAVVCVALTTFAQIALKLGVSGTRAQQALVDKDWMAFLWSAASSPPIIFGVAAYTASAVLWLFVLAKVEVSFAYPFVAVGFLLVMAFGAMYLGESVTWVRVLGTVLVVGGVLLVARS